MRVEERSVLTFQIQITNHSVPGQRPLDELSLFQAFEEGRFRHPTIPVRGRLPGPAQSATEGTM